jgi:hypothetical protein
LSNSIELGEYHGLLVVRPAIHECRLRFWEASQEACQRGIGMRKEEFYHRKTSPITR